jgi:hypothetical protein
LARLHGVAIELFSGDDRNASSRWRCRFFSANAVRPASSSDHSVRKWFLGSIQKLERLAVAKIDNDMIRKRLH